MKILFANNLIGFYGGVELVVLNYARGLARRGHTCAIAYGIEGRDATTYGAEFSAIYPCKDFGVSESGQSFDEIMAEVNPDVVFFHKVANLPEGIEHDSSIRKVRMVHDHDLWCPKGTGYYTHNRRTCHVAAGWRCYLDGAFLERSEGGVLPVKLTSVQRKIREMRRSHAFDSVLTLSTYMRDQLIRNGFPPALVHICHPVLEHDYPEATPVPEAPNLIFVGSLIRGKGVDFLLRSLKLVTCPFHLDIVGTGKSEDELRSLCAELGLSDQVTFVGWVDHDDVAQYYRNAKLTVVPSCWPEPFALVGQESMRHGRPVVAFDVGGISNWLDHEETGYLVPEQDTVAFAAAVECLLRDTSLAQEMGTCASGRVKERFSFEAFLDIVEGQLEGSP